MRSRGEIGALWGGTISLDARVVLVLKGVAVLYAVVAPFAWGAVDADLTAVYAMAFVLGAAAVGVDATLGALVLIGAAITAATINGQSRAAPAVSGTFPGAVSGQGSGHPRATALDLLGLDPSPVGRGGGREAFAAELPPRGPSEDTPAQECHDGADVPEATEGPRFLLDPSFQHGYVTMEGLAAAQTNQVPGSSKLMHSPLGEGSFSAQGTAAGVGVVPMVWPA